MNPGRKFFTKEEIVRKGLPINSDFCTGCGLCVAVCPVPVIGLDQSGPEPRLTFGERCNDCGICYKVCGGWDVPLRDLDDFVFGRQRDLKTEPLGIYRACYQANATDPEIRGSGASGGVVTALLVYALEKGLILAATVAAFDKEQPWKVKPALATTRNELIHAANSKYVIVPSNSAMAGPAVRELSGQVGCVGVPCQIHSLRKLQYRYPAHYLSKKIAFTIGIHCGSSRKMGQVERVLKDLLGIELDEISCFNYRKGKPPTVDTELIRKNGQVIRVAKNFWHQSGTVAARCLLCWDWGAELSDVSVGDFFGPTASSSDPYLGASTLIVRTEVGEKLVKEAVKAGAIKVYPTPVAPVLRSSAFIGKKVGRASALLTLKKLGCQCPDYQYEIRPMQPPDGLTSSGGASFEERDRYWAQRGIYPLA